MTRWWLVALDVAPDDVDVTSGKMFELGAQGLEERDGSASVTLVASFDDEETARAAKDSLGPSARIEVLEGDAWRDAWKEHFRPFRLCQGLWIRPPWEEHTPKRGERVLVLEPGRAFGTGLHETTSLAAEALFEHAARFRGSFVLDVGCGSGILSLVALALGASRVRAIDIDPDAIVVTRENAARNGMTLTLDADDTPLERATGPYAAVVANIEARTLTELAPLLVKRVAPGGFIVLAGILAPDAAPLQLDAVREAYATLREEEIRRKGDWVTLVLTG